MVAFIGEKQFEFQGLSLGAKEWGAPGDFPVIALHGWLDNCGSFDVLAPRLEGLHVVALDAAGHGNSSHRRDHGPYNIWQDVSDLYQVVEQLGWTHFALMGHSRGAMIAMLFAGTFPERVSHLALIDSIFPLPVAAEDAPLQLQKSIVASQKRSARRPNVFPDIETAIKVRQQSEVPIPREAAEYLMVRGLKAVEGGYRWSTDPKLLLPSAVKFSMEQIDAFVRQITAKVLLILARDGLPTVYDEYRKVLKRYPHIRVEEMSGGHHLHLGDPAADMAKRFNRFFQGSLS